MTMIRSFGTTIWVVSRDGFIFNSDEFGIFIFVLACVIMSGTLCFLEVFQKDRREEDPLLREARWYLTRKIERRMRTAAEATRWESLMAFVDCLVIKSDIKRR